MGKREFIEKISEELDYDKDKSTLINSIVEDTFFIDKTNKDEMISRFVSELNVGEEEAERIYGTVMNIMGSEIKNKIKHPFKDLDK